jgi:hypothetical protein
MKNHGNVFAAAKKNSLLTSLLLFSTAPLASPIRTTSAFVAVFSSPSTARSREANGSTASEIRDRRSCCL